MKNKIKIIFSICFMFIATFLLVGCGTSSDKITLKMTHTQNPGSISDLTAQHFKTLVEKRSDGRITVDIFSNCGLSGGDLTKAIELVQAGNIDIHSCAPANIANYDKRFYSFWLPYLFSNQEELLQFCESEKVRSEVNKWCNGLEMEMLGINNAGARQISNSKIDIIRPDDLNAMNIRVPGANIFINLYRNYFNANPTAMDFSEVYTALQQGTIDGQENPVAVFQSSKFDEVQKHLTLWDGVYDTTIWVMSSARLKNLSSQDQELIRSCAKESLEWGNDYLAENENKIISDLEEKGVKITRLTPEQKEAFKERSAGIYDEYRGIVGDEVIDLFTKGYKE